MTGKLHQIEIPCSHGRMEIECDGGRVFIHRYASRGKVHNRVANYELIDCSGRSRLLPLTPEIAEQILERIRGGVSYSSAFIFEESSQTEAIDMSKTEMEHRFTSTGIKFWRHQQQMMSYRDGGGRSVISTHVSPEGACNLKCPYCSVTYRDTHSRIEIDVIKKYVSDLQTRGLRAVILTGGGEPTAYKDFNDLVTWLKYERGLSVALITNGTLSKRIALPTWRAFSWVRVSINIFDGWEERIEIPSRLLSPDCVVGCSMVYTSEHEATGEVASDRLDLLRRAGRLATKMAASYVRLLPNCLLEQRELLLQHRALDRDLRELGDERFFHQHKVHGAPKCDTCHQAYFRPYLSEEKYLPTGQPGTVYPCDSVVLNDSYQHFASQYQLCHASQVLDFLDGRIPQRFDPRESCSGCVFTDNVNLLDDWKQSGVGRFAEFPERLTHEEFV